MKIKELLLPLGISLILFFFVNKFFFSSKPELQAPGATRSGQRFTAPTSKQSARPLNREIDFIDEKRKRPAEKTVVETDLAKFVFTTDGAALDRLEMKRTIDGKTKLINTVFPADYAQREDSSFLVALNERTPFYYEFAGKTETDSEIQVRYRYSSSAHDVNVNKIFTIFKETNKLNLTVEVEPKRNPSSLSASSDFAGQAAKDGVEARIFFPSPYMIDVQEAPYGVVETEKGKIEKTSGGSLKEQDGWHNPLLFGADNKFFSHMMVEDRDNFAQRAYFRGQHKEKIFAILEGPRVTQKTSWTVSFYLGPKEEHAMALVDPRLEQTLAYAGLLAPLSKILLAFLNYLYKYLGNYGFAIIILTLLVRLLLLPFTFRAEQGNKKRIELQKKLKYLEQKYKHDRETLAREKADLIRREGMPGLGGCLPLLLQLPLFFALSSVLRSSIEFYQAPFILWITDLSSKDPYYILPILMSGAMVVQGLMGDKSQRTMFIGMAVVFGVFLQGLSAGLLLYILVSTLLGLAQTAVQKKLKA